MLSNRHYTIKELTRGLDVTIRGDAECVIRGVCTVQQSEPEMLTFLANPLYRKYLPCTRAAAVVVGPNDASDCPVIAIITPNPHYVYAKMAAYFEHTGQSTPGVHPTAVIEDDAQIDPTASIGPHCVIGRQVKIGANSLLAANVVVGDFSTIGESVKIDANVTIYHAVAIGNRVHLASGVVIGSDGFGFAPQQGQWTRIPQLGGVVIGNDVHIGANTTIDRGTVEATVVEDGVKLDNLIQIAHNVRIGAHTVMAAGVAVAGSTVIGKHCMVGGASCFAGHISVCDHVVLTGMSSVTKSIDKPGLYSSGIVGAVPNQEFLKNNARFYRLESLMQRVKQLESVVKALKERDVE